MTVRADPWKYINRCLVCGTKLQFLAREKSRRQHSAEGIKFCSRNHDRFIVEARRNEDGSWTTTYRLPRAS